MSTMYLTTKDFSHKSGLSMSMVYKNIYNGRIKCFRQNGGLASYLIEASELQEFVKRPAKPIAHKPKVNN